MRPIYWVRCIVKLSYPSVVRLLMGSAKILQVKIKIGHRRRRTAATKPSAFAVHSCQEITPFGLWDLEFGFSSRFHLFPQILSRCVSLCLVMSRCVSLCLVKYPPETRHSPPPCWTKRHDFR